MILSNTTSLPLDETQPPEWNAEAQPVQYADETLQAFPISPDGAERMSFKIHYGLGEILKKSKDEIYNDLMLGGEENLRQQSIAEIDLRKQKAIDDALVQLAKNKGTGILEGADINFISQSILNMNKDTDPSSVFEQAYAREYMGALDRAAQKLGGENVLSRAGREIPKELEDARKAGHGLTSRYEYLNTIEQKINDVYNDQSWPSWGVDRLKEVVPGYLHSQMYDPSVGGKGWLGTNLDEQATATWKEQDFAKFKDIVDKNVTQYLTDNPGLALTYIKALKGQATLDVVINNALPAIDFVGIPVFKGGKALATKVGLMSETRGAIQTHLKMINNATPTPSNIAGSAGDLETAGILKANTKVVGEGKGMLPEATKSGYDQLPTGLKKDAGDIRSNPGNLGQEVANRIAEEYEQGGNTLIQKLFSALRVNRMGDVLASETTVKAVWDSIKDRFPGHRNRILDFSQPQHEAFSNTWWTDMHIGENAGRYFSSREAAEEYAKKSGIGSPNIISREGVMSDVPQAPVSDAMAKKIAAKEASLAKLEENTIPTWEKKLAQGGLKQTEVERLEEQITLAREVAANYKAQLDDMRTPKSPARTTYYVPRAAVRRPWESGTRLGEVRVEGGVPKYFTDDGAEVMLSTTRQEGMIPMQVSAKGRVKFLKDETPIETYYVPKAAIRRDWESGTRVGEIKTQGDKVRYYTDDGAEVELSKEPGEGLVRMDVTADGNVIFKGEEKPRISVEQQGVGYFIKISVPIREVDGIIRSAMTDAVETEGSRMWSPKGILNEWIAKLRTPEETLSMAQREARKVATYAPSIFREIMSENAKEIKALKGWSGLKENKRWADWQRVVEAGADLIDPDTKLRGYFFKSPGELEQYYQTHIKRLPDEKEIRAYFAFKRGMEYDRIFRNISQFRNMSRLGVESHSFSVLDDAGARISVPNFPGVHHKDFPTGEGNILVVGSGIKDNNVYRSGAIPKSVYEDLVEAVKEGRYKVVEDYSPETRRFKNFGSVGNRRIRYVLAPTMETKPLDWNLVPRRGGGHIDYDYDFYLKQAVVKKDTVGSHTSNIYEGDTTVMGIPVRAMGEDFAKQLNVVRELIKTKQNLAAEEASKKLGMSWDEVRGWFEPRKGEDGQVLDPFLSVDEPVYVVPRGGSTISISKEVESRYANFVDGTKSGSLAKQFQVEYTGERDAHNFGGLVNEGSREQPLYKINPAEKIDPISSMNRALQRIITSTYMDDYKIFSVESWLAEASQYLKESSTSIRHSPFWHFNNVEWKSDAPFEIRNRLEAQHLQIRQLIGIPSAAESFVHSAAQKMADSIYSKVGTKGFLLDPGHVLPHLRDPTRFVRGAVFHTSIGLFNIPQFIVQSMNYVNMLGIAGPRRALSGTQAAQFHFWSTLNHNPQILEFLDKKMSQLSFPGVSRWKPGEFIEARQAMIDAGFGNVGREYANLDDIVGTKVIQGKWEDFLDAGSVFFRGGERNARYGAWYTAYREWRDANPLAKLTDADKTKILERADLLNINMSRASSSMVHTGLLSIPAQFYTYQLRVTELMLGKRLGWQDKMRLFGVNAMMYGLPTAGGLYGLPFADSFRKSAQEHGYVVGDNFIQSAFVEGVPSSLMALATGGGDPEKGDWYNFGDRYGTGGFKVISDFFRGDKTIWDIFGGAAYSKLSGTYEATDGFRRAMMSLIRGDEDMYPLTYEDFLDPFREVSSANTGVRLGKALGTGRWESKKEAYLTDVSPLNAVFWSLTGMTDQRTSDVYRKSETISGFKNMEKRTEREFMKEFRRFVGANRDGNYEQARKYMTRARAALVQDGYPEDKIQQLISRAYDNNKSLVDRINWQYYMETGNRARKIEMREPYRSQLRNENNKRNELEGNN